MREAIAIRAVAPSETHVKAYIITVGRGLFKTPVSTLRRGGRTTFTPWYPHPSGEMLHRLQVELGHLADHELHELVEDLCQEITLCELNTPLAALHQCLGDTHKEWECWRGWPGGHLSKRGRVDSPGTTIPISYPCMTRWRMGSSGTTSTTPSSCSTKSRHGALNKYSGIWFTIRYP